jgi:toxin HigB-1
LRYCRSGNTILVVTFRDKETKRLWERVRVKKFEQIEKLARIKLALLGNATGLTDLRRIPGLHLEKLLGDRVGQHSIRINDQYRICFRWENDEAQDVEITDYH